MLDMSKLELSEKDRNQLQILDELISHEKVSASDIVSKIGISAATISRVFRNLKDKELIKYLGKEKTEKGRSPELFSINDEYGYMIHFYMTSSVIYGYLINIRGHVAGRYSIKYNQQGTLEELLAIIEKVKNELIGMNAQRSLRILAAGFSLPGVINPKSRMVHKIPDVYLLSDTRFFDYDERILGVPVIVNNVSWLATVGEKASVYPFVKDMAYITITQSTGIGMGIMIDNNLVKGGRNYAGEVGQTYFDNNCSFEEYVKGKGQLESEASLQTLYNRIEDELRAGKCGLLKQVMEEQDTDTMTLELLEEAAVKGDQDVKKVFDKTLKAWAMIIINIDLMINPELIVIGGSISTGNQYILTSLNEMFSRLGLFKPDIRLSVHGENAQLIGGIQALKEYAFNQVIIKEVIS